MKRAQEAVQKDVKLPPGYSLVWSGQFEYMQRAEKRMMVVIPLTLFIVFLIIFLNTRSLVKTSIVLLAVPLSLVGAFWLIYLLGYNLSVAVWVGMIALAGIVITSYSIHYTKLYENFFALIENRGVQRLTEKNKAFLGELLAIANARYAVGKTPQQDLFKVQVRNNFV